MSQDYALDVRNDRSAGGRIIVLDGLRGLSALSVAAFHFSFHGFPYRGYIAVDLFFLLSGYVIAGAYEDRLKRGCGTSWFFGVRMARLYPLYIVSMAIGAVLLCFRLSPDDIYVRSPVEAARLFFAAIFFIPSHISGFSGLYDLNAPMWSLAMEVLVNMVYAAWAYRLSNRALGRITVAAGMALAILTVIHGNADFGGQFRALNVLDGICRVFVSFPLGVIAYRLHRDGLLPVSTLRQPVLIGLIFSVYATSVDSAFVDLLAIFAIFPLTLMALLTTPDTKGFLAPIYTWTGRTSFALYATHFLLLRLFFPAVQIPTRPEAFARLPLILVAAIGIAVIAHYTVELPGKVLTDRLRNGIAKEKSVVTAAAHNPM